MMGSVVLVLLPLNQNGDEVLSRKEYHDLLVGSGFGRHSHFHPEVAAVALLELQTSHLVIPLVVDLEQLVPVPVAAEQ